MPKMSDSDLAAILDAKIHNALGYLRVPVEGDHRIRSNVITQSGGR